MTPVRAALAGVVVVMVVVVALLLRRDDADPAARIRAAIDRAVAATEAKDIGGVMEIVSERFDSASVSRADLPRILFAQLHGHGWRRVVLSDVDIRVEEGDAPERAKVSLVALLAKSDSKDGTWRDLAPSEASVYRFELDFVLEEGEWRVRQAAYRPARLGEP